MTALKLGAHIPWAQIDTYLEAVLDLELAPEIAIKGPELDVIDPNLLSKVSTDLQKRAVRPRVHAPFFDLNPGALDPLIREVTFKRLTQTLEFAAQLNANLLVLHPGVDKWRYPNLDQVWLENALSFFPAIIAQAKHADCLLAMENIYEESPLNLVQLVNRLDSPWFGHCFDAGHWHLFGRRPMAQWLDAISSKLFHLHLHDNHGRADEHLPVGAGTIDFTPLQKHLQGMAHQPSITLEAHQPEHLKQSLVNVKALLD